MPRFLSSLLRAQADAFTALGDPDLLPMGQELAQYADMALSLEAVTRRLCAHLQLPPELLADPGRATQVALEYAVFHCQSSQVLRDEITRLGGNPWAIGQDTP